MSQKKLAAWSKAQIVLGYDSRIWRRDRFGLYILYTDYGNRASDYGWEIDHIVPISKGGTDMLSNLEALHWRSNLQKSNTLFGLLRLRQNTDRFIWQIRKVSAHG